MGKITQQELDRRKANILTAIVLSQSKTKKIKAPPDTRRIKDRQLRDKYGIGIVEYESMSSEQGNCCKVCCSPCANLVVDHCHQSGKVRGLLCGHCNSGLGFFRDNTAVLTQAIEYLHSN